jgi:hypothetical protein
MKLPLQFVCIAACLAFPAPAAASTPDLDGLYRQQCSDIMSGAWGAFSDTLSPDYRGYNIGADPDTRATEANSIRDSLAALQLDACATTVDMREGTGTNANAIVHFRVEGVVRKPIGHLQAGDRVVLVFHSADTWKGTDGVWLQVSADTLGFAFSVNGKTVRQTGLI